MGCAPPRGGMIAAKSSAISKPISRSVCNTPSSAPRCVASCKAISESDPAMPHRFDPTILREYDIRGIVGKTLFTADAHAIGRAFAATLRETGKHRVAVGYDGRLTSPELEAALVEGLALGGADVIRVGLG